ncbi:MAG: tetratricopeptide repeat protein [Limisphaerales bacterium]
MDSRDLRRTFLVCLLLGLGTIALYAPALTFNYVNTDDLIYVAGNPFVAHGLSLPAFGWAFRTGYGGNWHPLTWISHMLDCQLFGLQPGGHHTVSILLHAVNAVLLFLVLRRMTNCFWRSVAVAALFAWHPLHVESVAWIAERKDVLSAFFWMLTLWAWMRYVEEAKGQSSKSKLFYLSALSLFALGLMSKPMVVTLPCALLLLDWWPLGRLRFGAAPAGAEALPPPGAQITRLVAEKIPFFVLSIASSVVTLLAARRQEALSVVAHLPFKVRFVTAVLSCFRYLAKTLWPSDLGATYPFMMRHTRWELIGAALILAAITVLALGARKSRPYWLFGWLWFLGTLLPALNLVAVGAQPMADRYMYIPSIGLLILICWEVFDLAAATEHAQLILGGIWGAALVGCCVLTSFQLQIWRNEETLVSHIAMPRYNFRGHADYAAFHMRHNQLARAEVECNQAISILPTYGLLYLMQGDILRLEGKFDRSVEKLSLALKYDPGLVGARIPLGRAYLGLKRPADAAGQFRAVLQCQPRNFEADAWLARSLLIQGKTNEGIAEFRRTLSLQPNEVEVLNDLAWLLATSPHSEIRNGAEAVKLASQACQLTGNKQPLLMGTLAAAYAEAGRWDEAVAAAQKAHDLAAAGGQKAVAERNLQLRQLYRSHQAFHEKQ